MKRSSIKYSIIINFLISGLLAFFLTTLIVILGFALLHILSKRLYEQFAELYNSNTQVMVGFSILCFLIFMVLIFFIFIKRMNKITNYIAEISRNLKIVSQGNLDINIPVRTKDELGTLAKDVNKMAYDLKEIMERERQWENQKNNLITNLSHDLRTPLTSILGFLELIQKGNYKDQERLQHYSEISFNKAKDLKNSIDQLFEFTKINNSDLKLNKYNICIEELVEQVTIGFIPDFEKSNMEYRIVSKDKGMIIYADALLLARAFENIISNSIKYGSEGKYLDINIERNDDSAIVRFINYGEEIKEEDIKNLFDKFYRVEKKCDKNEGTGLGLAIVKTILEIQNGSVEVTSSKDKTQFELRLPLIN